MLGLYLQYKPALGRLTSFENGVKWFSCPETIDAWAWYALFPPANEISYLLHFLYIWVQRYSNVNCANGLNNERSSISTRSQGAGLNQPEDHYLRFTHIYFALHICSYSVHSKSNEFTELRKIAYKIWSSTSRSQAGPGRSRTVKRNNTNNHLPTTESFPSSVI